jgi:hypothetical protein
VSYLRSTLTQERLNGLAILCVEKKLLDEIDLNNIIDDFVSRNKCFWLYFYICHLINFKTT